MNLIQINDITNNIDYNLFNLFKEQFNISVSSLITYQPINYPYIYYQILAIKNFLISSTQRFMSVYQGNEKIVDIIFDKSNLVATVTLLKPTLIVLSISLIYVLVQSISQYGFEKVTVYVKDKSISLIINVKVNSKEYYMEEINNDINEKLKNIALISIVLYFFYKNI